MAKKQAASPAINREQEPDEVFVYIGPSIRGVCQSGAIYTGTRTGVLFRLRDAIARYPQIERLVVRDTELAAAKQMIKEGGNALAHAYQCLRAPKE